MFIPIWGNDPICLIFFRSHFVSSRRFGSDLAGYLTLFSLVSTTSRNAAMASLAFLLLGAPVSFVASVDPLEAWTQKARQLQELQNLSFAPITAGCASACPDIQSAYDEMECLVSKGTQEVLKGYAGLFCSHKSAITCAQAQSACSSVLVNYPNTAASLDCICSECPKIGHAFSDLPTVLALLGQSMQGQTIDEGAYYTLLCPMIGPAQCMASSSLCTSYLEAEGSTVPDVKLVVDYCTSEGYPTNYNQDYTYGGCASEASAASGLVGLNLLFLTFSLLFLSIHKWMTSECGDTRI